MRNIFLICIFLMVSGLSLAQDEDQLTPYQITLARIEKAKRTKVYNLDLSYLGLETLPSEIGQLIDLRFLYLSNNHLTELPVEISNLSNLYHLDLYGNDITYLPPEIAKLSRLQKLSLSYNQLTVLPPEFGQLTNLRFLWLSSNDLISLPPEIGQLTKLCHMDVSNNHLNHLPSDLGQLTRLTEENCGFSFSGNPLISPPAEVIAQGTRPILEYLRNQAGWHLQRLIGSGATGIGLLIMLVLGLRWRMCRTHRKSKKKRFDTIQI